MSILNGPLGEVPRGWRFVVMDDLKAATRYPFVGGPFGSNLTRGDYVEVPGVPVIRGTNLGGDACRFKDGGFVYVTEEKADSLLQNLAYPGDLVFTQPGTLGQVVEIPEDARFGRYVVSQSQMKLTVDGSKALPRYLCHFFRSPIATAYLNRRIQATGVPHINLEILKQFPVLLPPVPQQRRIAAILDKADAIRRRREEGIRLTEELLRSTFLEMFGDPVTNPSGWPQRALGDVLSGIENGWSPRCHDHPVEDGEWGVLKLGAVTCCKYQPHENKALPADERPRREIEVKAGDLLLTRKNTYELVAACVYVFETPPRLMLPDLIFRLKISSDACILPEYLWGLLTHVGKRKRIQTLAGGSAGSMPNISKGKLLRLPIEIPPVKLQRQFAKVTHRLHLMEITRRAQHDEHKRLFSALVRRAFRGEL